MPYTCNDGTLTPTYIVTIPLTREMSAIQFVVSDRPSKSWYEEALWYYNNARDYDGLPPLKALPKGTTKTDFKLIPTC